MAFNPVYTSSGDNKLDVYGSTEVGCWVITFGASDTYVIGGLALAAATFGLSRPILGINILGVNTAAITLGIGDNIVWNYQTQKLQFEGASAGIAGSAPIVELTSGTSIASMAIEIQIFTQR
jgi:hypothetical protein